MTHLKTFFTTASGVFAVIPGLGILLTNIGVPPDTSKYLFAGVVESLGVITLLILSINAPRLKKLTIQSITSIALLSVAVFVLSLFGYLFLYDFFVIQVPGSPPLFFPLWASGELDEGLKYAGSKAELIRQWGRDDVYKVISSSSPTALATTKLIFLFIYQLIFVALTFSFGVLGIKTSTRGQRKVKPLRN
jgi:hypothetical protein